MFYQSGAQIQHEANSDVILNVKHQVNFLPFDRRPTSLDKLLDREHQRYGARILCSSAPYHYLHPVGLSG